jgi:2-polyprenyl-3-methyl-5-hydroxy-6-metoxy-1,4-benzoquinol methylase
MVSSQLVVRPRVARMLQLTFTNPLQRKRIERFLARQDESYWEFAEDLLGNLSRSFLQTADDWAAAARCYNDLCMECVRLQIAFRKSGTYPKSAQDQALEEVYSRPEVMRSYMVGLLLTYLFWPNQYRMFRLFKDHLAERAAGTYLEVGVGHGLFLAEAMRTFPDLSPDVIDISATSIGLAREILQSFDLDASRVRFTLSDFLQTAPPRDGGYDMIAMGELLEHVDKPQLFLQRSRDLLAPDGTYFITTCVNCPAVDHVYHFHTVDEIRDMVRSCGLEVRSELVLPAEDVPLCRCEKELVTINYAALLTRRG